MPWAIASHTALSRWLDRFWRRTLIDEVPLVLHQRRIYVLPTRGGIAYVATLGLMLVASINYNLSLGYSLVFLLAGLGVVTIIHTFRNLVRLSISPTKSEPGFAGGIVHFGVRLESASERHRLCLRFDDGEWITVDIAAGNAADLRIPLPATRRGWLGMPRLTLQSTWPLGLVRAWSYARLPQRCLVYPQPAGEALPLPPNAIGGGLPTQPDADDFSGLRPHQRTDPPQRVAWKASARLEGDALLSKQFAAAHNVELWFAWETAPGDDAEARIANLTRWIVDAEAANQRYGLRLPGWSAAPANGSDHLHACLAALALHDAT